MKFDVNFKILLVLERQIGKFDDVSEVFETQAYLKVPRGEVFAFFSDPRNLEEMTPPWLHFSIIAASAPKTQKGSLFEYRLRIKGFPVRWKTLIEEWEPPVRFVDVQLKGPYRRWHHTHEFHETDSGTLMIDRVRYQLHLGWIGSLLAGSMVRRDIQTIFDYRREIMARRFPSLGGG